MNYIKLAMAIGLAAVAVWVAVAAFNVLTEDVDDDYQSKSYGVSNIGAETIEFRVGGDGATGGYTIHSFAGNTIYAPTEWKNSQTSSSAYTQISKSGYVLMGWSTSGHDGSISLYPGQVWQVQGNSAHKTVFYAVWKQMESGNDNGNGVNDGIDDVSSESHIVSSTSAISIDTHNGTNKSIVNIYENGGTPESSSGYTYRVEYTLSISYNNGPESTRTENNNKFTVNNNNVYVGWADGQFRITGTPYVGVYAIHLHFYSYSRAYSTTTERNYDAYWYLSAYSEATDPSNIYYITHSQYVDSSRSNFQNNHGPTGTAIVLPDRVDTYGSQDGWNAEREGQPAYVPLGGTYVITHDYNLTSYSVTYEQALSKIAIVAYNANGGDYTGHIAHAAERGTYTSLSNKIVTKPGYYFLGWNLTGSESDPIYPGGYQYYVDTNAENQGEYYIELKAVWSTSNPESGYTITCRGLDGDERYTIFKAVSNHSYYLPETGFDVNGYDFLGWATIQYEKGTGTVTVSNPVTVTGEMPPLYPVYKKTIYTCTVIYDKNGGEGSMADKVVHPESLPAIVQLDTCRFVKNGSTFIGWSENPNATTPTVGDTWTFNRSGEIRLYAVWSESSTTEKTNQFVVIYNGNGTNVSNIVTPYFSMTTPESKKSITVNIPSWEPVRQGYSFMGWSTSPNGEVQFRNNGATPTPENTEDTVFNSFTMTLTGTDTYIQTILYAKWESNGSSSVAPTEKVNVTYMKDDEIVKTLKVDKGSVAIYYSPESVEGRSFFGWYNGTEKWDFLKPVNSDLVLKANYIKVFTVQIEDKSVKVIIDSNINSSYYKVEFSDGFEETYYTKDILAHEVDSDGTVTVTVETESGKHVADWNYTIGTNGTGGGDEPIPVPDPEPFPVDTIVAIAGGVIGIIAILALAGRFLI